MNRRREYGIGQINGHLLVFLDRFLRLSWSTRTCILHAPKVSSGGSLPPSSSPETGQTDLTRLELHELFQA